MNDMTFASGMTQQQFMEGARMMMRGWSMLCSSMADMMGEAPMVQVAGVPAADTGQKETGPHQRAKAKSKEAEAAVPVAEAPKVKETTDTSEAEDAKAEVTKAEAAQTEATQATPEEAKPVTPAAEDNGGKKITRKDLQRAMGMKIKALAAKGGNPDAIGELFPKFGAKCISELDEGKYAAFLEALNAL